MDTYISMRAGLKLPMDTYIWFADIYVYVCHSFTFPGGLKPPMDTYLHVCKREVNHNPTRTKAKIISDVLGPK